MVKLQACHLNTSEITIPLFAHSQKGNKSLKQLKKRYNHALKRI
jgi:hypothetical protein